MIRYALVCDAGHVFDSWFRDSTTYEQQETRGLVTCPVCQSVRIEKSIMAPALRAVRTDPAGHDRTTEPATLLEAASRETRDRLRAIRAKILDDSQDVGRRFPEEARRIHDGDSPNRQISGEATIEEARALLEDGILILPIPAVADELD